MEKIAFISGGTFIYWSSIILTLAVVAAMAVYAGIYICKSGNVLAAMLTLPSWPIMIWSIMLNEDCSMHCRATGTAMLRTVFIKAWFVPIENHSLNFMVIFIHFK